MTRHLTYSPEDLASLCRRHGIERLFFFGSVLRDDFDPERSDVDVLVAFTPEVEARLTYLRLGGIAAELEDLLGRRVDLSLANSLDRRMRDSILASAEVQYDAA
jgi:hypothetical protein